MMGTVRLGAPTPSLRLRMAARRGGSVSSRTWLVPPVRVAEVRPRGPLLHVYQLGLGPIGGANCAGPQPQVLQLRADQHSGPYRKHVDRAARGRGAMARHVPLHGGRRDLPEQ